MRYYAIKLDGAPSAFPAQSGALIPGAQWCSVINGQNDPGALNVQFDIIQMLHHQAGSGSMVRIWGIPYAQLSQAANLWQIPCTVYGGMFRGLPIATSQMPEAGLLIKGLIQPALGNWRGTDMTLDLIIVPGGEPAATQTSNTPINLIHNWQPNTPLSQAMKTTLQTAFPGKKLDIQISPQLKLPYADQSFHGNLNQYADYIKSISQTILGSQNYPGVFITMKGDTITVADQTTPINGSPIQSVDIIGQPTWVGAKQISVDLVMRGDLDTQQTVTLPPTIVGQAAGGGGAINANQNIPNSFQGKFQISNIRHVGNFRQPPGESWMTTIQAAVPADGGGQSGSSAAGGGAQQFYGGS